MADTVVQELVINTLTQAQFDAAKEAGTLSPYELYGTPDTSARLPVLTPMWFDHIANDVSWLRADTFSWQSGDVYVAAYEHLVGDYESATTGYSWTGDTTGNIYITKGMPSVGDTVVGGGYTVGEVSSLGITVYKNGSPYETATLNSAVSGLNTSQTDTIGDITITYYLADDGHKICLPDQESNLVALYEATGIAWYYILDTTNRQFKLPRTKWGFTGLRDSVGGYIAPGLPDHNHKIIIDTKWGSKSANNGPNWCGDDATRVTNIAATSTNASQSNSIYGNSDTVQPPATQMYLYFYVGNFEQSAIEQTAGLNAEMFNDLNAHKVIEFQAPTSANNYTWYRKYADGWVEQGGRCTVPTTNGISSSRVNVTLPVPIATPEQATLSYNGIGGGANFANCENQASVTTTTVSIGRWNNGGQAAEARDYNWTLSGMSAQ